MLLLCPEFLAKMPKDEKGEFYAIAGTFYFDSYPKFSLKMKSKRKAYLRARWEALKLDWCIAGPQGVYWEIGEKCAFC